MVKIGRPGSASNAGDAGSVPGQGTKIPTCCVVHLKKKKKKKRLVGEVAKYVEKHSAWRDVRSGLRGQKRAPSLRNWEEWS